MLVGISRFRKFVSSDVKDQLLLTAPLLTFDLVVDVTTDETVPCLISCCLIEKNEYVDNSKNPFLQQLRELFILRTSWGLGRMKYE